MGVPVEYMAELMQRPAEPIRGSSQSRLHNFSFPTGGWGHRRLLRCSKVSLLDIDANHKRSPSPSLPSPSSSSPFLEELPSSPLIRDGWGGGKVESGEHDELFPSTGLGKAMPWNLRTRRAACGYPDDISENNKEKQNKDGGAGRLLRSGVAGPDKGGKRKLSISLSREEIEEDFFALIGRRPPLKNQKKSKGVQKHLDSYFPGSWLPGLDITPELYNLK